MGVKKIEFLDFTKFIFVTVSSTKLGIIECFLDSHPHLRVDHGTPRLALTMVGRNETGIVGCVLALLLGQLSANTNKAGILGVCHYNS